MHLPPPRRGEQTNPPVASPRAGYRAGVTFRQAAEVVLSKAKRPLTAGEITALAIRQGLLQTAGKTPEASMSAALYTAPTDGPIRRRFVAGGMRAKRGSVRWTYVTPARSRGSAPQA